MKVFGIVVSIVIGISLGSAAGIAMMVNLEVYTTSKETVRNELFKSAAISIGDDPVGSGNLIHLIDKGVDLLCSLRYAIFAILAVCVVLAILCIVFLLCGAGHREGQESIAGGPFTKLPFDLFTAGVWLLLLFCMYFYEEFSFQSSVLSRTGGMSALLLTGCLLLVGWCVSFAVRFKLGDWWKHTLLWQILRLVWIGVRTVCRWLRTLLRNIPLVWKTLFVFVVICVIEFLWWGYFRHDTDVFLFGMLIEKLVLLSVLLWIALSLRKLQKGGAALAAGEFSSQIDTNGLLWDFKRHGENLNSIAGGMAKAVEARTRSERMKTELITNVSHDIKTPLTSIINYVDLLNRETDQNQRQEYLEVLQRQTHRLKKLTEDLVEVSKASTGNLEVHLAQHDGKELLQQAAGEYSERLEAAGIEPVLQLPEEEVSVLADGALMWRVLDNLFSNVCKYAQPGTRFYLEVRPLGDCVIFDFKNISREPLNVTAEELRERFVRGDNARTGEGSGLGLSIAESLVRLQHGDFHLSVDGDLFKASVVLSKA